ncbi:MAG: endolytic transglycosylase MltG [Clostridiales bacterium]|jgi:hypothetical protein|nr:endolytic transglycosylase MltG [Clostridiales bacterium]
MNTKTFLFGFGVGTILVSAFLFFIFLIDRGIENGKVIAEMSNQEIVARADELITEANGRGIQGEIDISAIADIAVPTPVAVEMTEQEIVDAASGLGMIFPTIIVEPTEPPLTDTPTPTPVPTDTPVPTPTATPVPTPEPTATPTPVPEPSSEDQGDSVHVTIPMGATSNDVCVMLQEAGIVQDAAYFNQYIMESGMDESLRYGEFDIPKDSTAVEILDIITS